MYYNQLWVNSEEPLRCWGKYYPPGVISVAGNLYPEIQVKITLSFLGVVREARSR